jgi:hypothetical protein
MATRAATGVVSIWPWPSGSGVGIRTGRFAGILGGLIFTNGSDTWIPDTAVGRLAATTRPPEPADAARHALFSIVWGRKRSSSTPFRDQQELICRQHGPHPSPVASSTRKPTATLRGRAGGRSWTAAF